MSTYRYYLLDDQDHVRWAERIEADELTKVHDQARATMKDGWHTRSVEIWRAAIGVYPPVAT